MSEKKYVEEKLEIYLNYDFLTAEQYANIILATNNIFKTIIQAGLDLEFEKHDQERIGVIAYLDIPLVIEEANTGNSINTKFSLENRFFPSIKIEGEDTIHFILPKYSAALIIAGSIITYGVEQYEKYLDIRIKQIELNDKQYDYEKKLNDELISQTKTIKDSGERLQSINQNYYLFQSQVQAKNINTTVINGVVIKEIDDNRKLNK